MVGSGVGSTVADGVAVTLAVGEPLIIPAEITSVKKAARSTVTAHGGTPCGPWKLTVTRTILLRSADLLAVETGKTAKPSDVVLAVIFTSPSIQCTVAVPVAGKTPSGLPLTLCTNLT